MVWKSCDAITCTQLTSARNADIEHLDMRIKGDPFRIRLEASPRGRNLSTDQRYEFRRRTVEVLEIDE